MQFVFTLNPDRTPVDPVHPKEARNMLKNGEAAIFRRYPFTVIRKEPIEVSAIGYRLKLDPGSKTTGIAVLAGDRLVWAAELTHRGFLIKKRLQERSAVRRSRRNRKTRYRIERRNRNIPKGWLPPSIMSRIYNIETWVRRLRSLCPISAISQELNRFDMQKMNNPEIEGVEYQQGTLAGYEVREYLLEKWHRKCAYCGAENTPLQIEHIKPRSKGGSDSVANLALACVPCNQKKGNRSIQEFLKNKPDVLDKVLSQAKRPLADAAAVNASRWCLFRRLKDTGLDVEAGTGGRTKFNRTRMDLPKTHWLDAACVGASTPESIDVSGITPLLIRSTGYGSRQVQQNDSKGFPKGSPKMRSKRFMGFKTGDLAIAVIPKGKYTGRWTGRVTIRARPAFGLKTDSIEIGSVHPKYLKKIHSMDGYSYS